MAGSAIRLVEIALTRDRVAGRPRPRGWASPPSSPAAAGRKPRSARLLHFVTAFQVQPTSFGATAGPLLAAHPLRRGRCGFEKGV